MLHLHGCICETVAREFRKIAETAIILNNESNARSILAGRVFLDVDLNQAGLH